MFKQAKNHLLSNEISKCRAMLAGGSRVEDIEKRLIHWKLQMPVKGMQKPSNESKRWLEILLKTVSDSKKIGNSLLQIFSRIQPLIRSSEGLYRKKQILEKQFAMQGALGVVLPWCISFFLEDIGFNFFIFSAIALQLFGILLFFLIFYLSFRTLDNEESWILDFLNILLPKTMSGFSFSECIKTAILESRQSVWKNHWSNWLSFVQANQYEKNFHWPENTVHSEELSYFFEKLIETGAPASEVILDTIETLGFEKNACFEEKMATLPSKISLVFCVCFAPSVFMIVMGALWPMLQKL